MSANATPLKRNIKATWITLIIIIINITISAVSRTAKAVNGEGEHSISYRIDRNETAEPIDIGL